jgi:DNA-binding GntR family transcriptional regulator
VANALKRLAGEGFVRLTPHREAFVAPMSPAEIEDIYLMRAALEAEAAALAARTASSSDVAALRQLNKQIGQTGAGPRVAPIRAADLAFHAHVRALSCMPRLIASIGNLVDQCDYYRARLLDSRGLLTPDPRVHDELLEALAQNDVERARAYMREHVLRGMRSVLLALENGGVK